MSNKTKSLKEIGSADEFQREAILIAEKRFSPNRVTSLFGVGSETGASDRRSREVIDKIYLRQQIIHEIEPSTEISFLGYKLKTPIMIAPMASMAIIIEDGVRKMCYATRETGSITWIASNPRELYGNHSKNNPIVYIEKPLADRVALLNKLAEAEQEGCIAVGIDVDSGGGHKRWNMSSTASWKPLSVKELRELRESLSKPFVIKGVLSLDDASHALEAGADIIVVSNHYGVTLDYAQAPLEVLPAISEKIGKEAEVLVDCQMRRGTDVLKALALGGKAVLVGRPILWAALFGEAEGMIRLIHLMTEELKRAMLFTGMKSATKISKDILILPKDVFRDS